MFRRGNRAKRLLGYGAKALRFESLESRCLLAGTVDVIFAGGVLRFEGDADPNEVKITPGDNPGEYKIEGVNTTINGPTSIEDPVDRIEVELDGGSDTFSIEGQSVNNQLIVTGEVEIENEDGANTNRFMNAFLSDYLTIMKTSGVSESYLDIEGTTIVGITTVNNFAGGEGASKTTITGDSHLQDDLDIDNGAGQDILVVYASRIDGDVDIDNGDGDTRTIFGLQEDPIVFGDLILVNGDGNDKVVLHDTSVWGEVDLDLGDGHTDVVVEMTHVGLGLPVGGGTSFELDAGAGFDQFLMVDSTVRNTLDIDTASAGGDTFGSRVEIRGDTEESVIGNDFNFDGDNGREVVLFTNSRVVDDVDLDLFDGSSEVVFSGSEIGERLDITSDAGVDKITFTDGTIVWGDVDIALGAGVDLLELLAAVQFLGSSSLDGGDDIDTFLRQIGPPVDAVDIAFLATETFEIDEFIT